MEEAIQTWEGEGGTVPLTERHLIGTLNQIEWAMRIKTSVSAEFDRVAKALESAADKQAEADQRNTRALIAILEENRAAVMAKDQAGYFIRNRQELRDQVRQMIVQDSRYQTMKVQRAARDADLAYHKHSIPKGELQ